MGIPMINTNKAREFTGFASKNERILQKVCAKLESYALSLEEDDRRLCDAIMIHECVEQLCELELKP